MPPEVHMALSPKEIVNQLADEATNGFQKNTAQPTGATVVHSLAASLELASGVFDVFQTKFLAP